MAVSPSKSRTTQQAAIPVGVVRVAEQSLTECADSLAVEEPLEIRLRCLNGGDRAISVTMRTPGHDRELAVGYLFTEGIVTDRDQVLAVHACKSGTVVRVELRPDLPVDMARLARISRTTSSCGVCGKLSLDAVRVAAPVLDCGRPVIDTAVIQQLPGTLRAVQVIFDRTGGLHAAALFDAVGNLVGVREDVGRHNALDKLIGAEFLAGRTPLHDRVLLVSGRASFELVQKAAVAGIPILAAVGAPSSGAVDLAREHGLTLVGFVRRDGFNVYTGVERIASCLASPSGERG